MKRIDEETASRGMRCYCTMSEDRVHRFSLMRVWDTSLPCLVWIMLNPSKADASVDDPTIRKCIGFARSWGYGSILVYNLWPFRATSPMDLAVWLQHGADDEAMAENLTVIRESAVGTARASDTPSSKWPRVVLAWGNSVFVYHAIKTQASKVVQCLRPSVEVVCLGTTQNGQPRHPLMLAYNTPVQKYEAVR